MSFKSIEDTALGITQGYFGEYAQYKRGSTTISIKAVFSTEWIEINGVSSRALTTKILKSDLSSLNIPQKGDQVIYNSTTYTVTISQPDSFGGFTLILSE